MKKLLLAAATLAITASASAAPGLPEFPSFSLSDFLLPSVRGDHGRGDRYDDRRYYDDHHDRGRHRGHYKRRYRDDRPPAPVAPVVPVPVPVPVLPPHPPLPPGAPRPPGF